MPFVSLRPTRHIGILLAWLLAAGSVWAASSVAATGMSSREIVPDPAGAHRVTLHVAVGSTSMTATLEDNPTARDFAALFPLTVTLREFSPAEKVSGVLPRRLSEDGAPATDSGAVGDIAYYAPWGNIAFYRGRGTDAAGVIKIARITSRIEALHQTGQVRVTISRAK